MNNVIVGELICALWENWQTQKQPRINTIPAHSDNDKSKIVDDHDHDHNQSISTAFRVPISIIHDERYMLSPLRI